MRRKNLSRSRLSGTGVPLCKPVPKDPTAASTLIRGVEIVAEWKDSRSLHSGRDDKALPTDGLQPTTDKWAASLGWAYKQYAISIEIHNDKRPGAPRFFLQGLSEGHSRVLVRQEKLFDPVRGVRE
jgi:hypothetical protein